jgi:hypothetical protein
MCASLTEPTPLTFRSYQTFQRPNPPCLSVADLLRIGREDIAKLLGNLIRQGTCVLLVIADLQDTTISYLRAEYDDNALRRTK